MAPPLGWLGPLLLLLLIGATIAASVTGVEVSGEVSHISGNSVYIDVGRSKGIAVGDTVDARRGQRRIGGMVVISVASTAASCRPLFPVSDVRVGDRVTAIVAPEPRTVQPATGAAAPGRAARPVMHNRLRGKVSLGSRLSRDLTKYGLDFSQPVISARFKIDDIAGIPLSLEVRHRSRYHDRARRLGDTVAASRWSHSLSEFSFTYSDPRRPYRVEFGRILPRQARGVGYVDGLMLVVRPRDDLNVGAAGGTRPDLLNSGYRSDEKVVGLFTTFEQETGAGGKAAASAAFTGSYRGGEVSREYIYLQGGFSSRERLSTTGSVEADLNRGWRRTDGKGPLDLTNLYLTGRYRVSSSLSFSLSYDARKRLRTADTRAVPDSLFDDSTRRGFHMGTAWALSRRIHLTGSAGVRLRRGMDDTFSGSGGIRVRDFPFRSVSTSARLALFRTMFTRGYRPMVGLGLSPLPGLMVSTRVGDTVYDGSGSVTHNPWVASNLMLRLNRRNYLSAYLTGYLGASYRSVQLSAETGVLF